MKERYEEIVSEVITFEKADIIVTSPFSAGSNEIDLPNP